MNYIKYILVLGLFVFLYTLQQTQCAKNVDMGVFREKIQPDTNEGEIMQADEGQLRKLYGISGDSVEDYLLYIPAEIMSVEELLILKVKHSEEMAGIRAQVEERLESQKKSFESYGATQTAALNKARLEVRGSYLFFAVSEYGEQWQKIFEEELKR